MTRRTLLFAMTAAALHADSAHDAWELLTVLAASLVEGNIAEFMDAFDRAMPGYETLRANVTALMRQDEVQSAIDPVRNEGDDRARTVEIDWVMSISDRADTAHSTQRHETVECRLAKQGKKWKIVAFQPLTIFVPPKIG